MSQAISFYIGLCHICQKTNVVCANITTLTGPFEFCRPCINKKFDEKLGLTTEKNEVNKRQKL